MIGLSSRIQSRPSPLQRFQYRGDAGAGGGIGGAQRRADIAPDRLAGHGRQHRLQQRNAVDRFARAARSPPGRRRRGTGAAAASAPDWPCHRSCPVRRRPAHARSAPPRPPAMRRRGGGAKCQERREVAAAVLHAGHRRAVAGAQPPEHRRRHRHAAYLRDVIQAGAQPGIGDTIEPRRTRPRCPRATRRQSNTAAAAACA